MEECAVSRTISSLNTLAAAPTSDTLFSNGIESELIPLLHNLGIILHIRDDSDVGKFMENVSENNAFLSSTKNSQTLMNFVV